MSENGVQTRQTSAVQATLKDVVKGQEFLQAIASVLPKHMTADRFARIAMAAMTKTPKLAKCTKASFVSSCMTLSQLGLEPDGRRAHLIPFENRKLGIVECQLIVDYKGLVELVMRAGGVSNIHADVVCDADEFEYDMGAVTKHRINFRQSRGEMYAAYAVVRFRDGSSKFEVMTKDEISSIRARSRAGNSGPWVTDFNEMAKKTVFRRLTKWIPLSAEYRDALDADADALEVKEVAVTASAPKPLFTAAALPEVQKPMDQCDGNHAASVPCSDPNCWQKDPPEKPVESDEPPYFSEEAEKAEHPAAVDTPANTESQPRETAEAPAQPPAETSKEDEAQRKRLIRVIEQYGKRDAMSRQKAEKAVRGLGLTDWKAASVETLTTLHQLITSMPGEVK